MSNLQLFNFDADTIIRTDATDEGEPIVCAADLARIFGLRRPDDAYRRIDDEFKVSVSTRTPGGLQEMVYLCEAGVYELAATVRLRKDTPHYERIKAFRRWLFAELLPTIRKTGRYEVEPRPTAGPAKLAPIADEVEATLRVARLLGLAENQALISSRNRILRNHDFDIATEFQLALPSPENKVQRNVTQVAEVVSARLGTKWSAVAVNKFLCEAGWQAKHPDGKHYEPSAEAKARGALLVDTGKSHGRGVPVQMLVWQGDDVVDFIVGAAGTA